MRPTIDLGNRIEMMVDDVLIEHREHLHFVLNRPIEADIAIEADKPWEGKNSFAYGSVLEKDGTYYLYYRAVCNDSGLDTDPGQYLCVALSEDGVHWRKPELDIVPFGSHRRTNILLSGETSGVICHNFTPCLDTNPNCPADERIKAVGGYAPDGLFVFVSADGLHFRRYSEQPAITGTLLDSQNVLLYDLQRAVYRIYSRYFHTEEGKEGGIRAIRSCESSDCIHWSEPVENRYANGDPGEQLYTNATIVCPGAEHMLLAVPMRFVPGRAKKVVRGERAVSDAVFMSSRDGFLWDRRFMESWIAGGLDERRWTQRNNMPLRGCLELGNDFCFFASAHYCWEDARIVRYRLRRHGFASLRAGEAIGFFMTKPLTFRGSALHLNYSTAATGGIRAELLDVASGQTIEGFSLADCETLYGDSLDETLTFRGGRLDKLAGRAVQVRFEMRLADLYAWRFE